MKYTIFTAWFDIHAAHTDPFRGGEVHGHLWRVRLGAIQDTEKRGDIRMLLNQCRVFCERKDHRNLGAISTEDIAVDAISYTDCDVVQVEEVGICTVELFRQASA